MHRGPVAEISLSAIAHNLRTVQRIVKNRPVIAVVKADAYGHGAVEVSKRLIQEGIHCLAVAYMSEAMELRDSGIDFPVMVLFDKGGIKDYFNLNLLPVVCSADTAHLLSDEAIRRNTVIRIHVKIDTGMGRLGLSGNYVVDDLMKIAEMPGLEMAGLLSHFSEADLSDRSYAISQLDQFNAIQNAFSHKTKKKIFSHVANSAAVLSFEEAYLDAVRPGIMLYGCSPLQSSAVRKKEQEEAKENMRELIPVMQVKARILSIRNVPSGTPISYGRTFITQRQSRIGVITMGYADGYFRSFSNRAEMLVRGKRVPVVGRVCMDITMVDLTDVSEAEENDEVIILGGQGMDSITADELALKANTISYEILTTLGSRSRRTYVESH